VRGFGRPGDYNSRVLLLVDGLRVNDNVYDGALSDRTFPVHLDLVERVEFAPGPGSAAYGSNALFGVINVVTRAARDLHGVEIAGDAGSGHAGGLRASVGERSEGGTDVLVSTSRSRSRGRDFYYQEFDAPATNGGVAEGLDHEDRRDAFVKLAKGDFTLTAAHVEREKGIPTASYGQVFNDPRSRTVDAQSFVDLRLDRALDAGRHVQARVFAGRYRYFGDYVYDYPPVTVNRDRSDGRWWGAEVKHVQQLAGGHTLAAGAEYQANRRQEQINHDVDPYASYLDDRRSGHRAGAYVAADVRLGERWLASAGLRRDEYSDAAGATSPRLALIYKPWAGSSIKAIHGRAYRAPNVYERYYATAPTNKSNPDLGPERVLTEELVYEQYVGARARFTGSLYSYHAHDLISLVTDPADGALVFRNVDRARARGVEVEGEWRGVASQLRASYARQSVRDESTGEELTNAPRTLAKLNLSLPAGAPDLRAGFEAQYVGRRRTLATHIGGYTVANLTLVHSGWAKGLEASVGVYNLFDRRYRDPGSVEHRQDAIEQEGRSLRAKLVQRF
jgi:iron complex outermembrane receptor protein